MSSQDIENSINNSMKEIENSHNENESSHNEIENSHNENESSHNYEHFEFESVHNSENSMADEMQSISKISKFSNDSIYQSNLNILMEMGYSKNYIKKIFYFFKPRTLENAIELMTIENNLYIHDFFPNNKLNPNFCYICGESKKLHKNIKSNNEHSSNSNNNNINNQNEFSKEKDNINEYQNSCENINEYQNSSENIPIKKKIFCLICDSNSEFIEKIHLNCHHIYCHECWFIYLKGKIENNKLFEVKCMNYECNEKLSNEFIMQYIESDEELIKKYLKFKNRIELMKRKDIKFCPFPDCEGFSKINNNSNYCKCNFGHEFCLKCNNKWHKNTKCKNLNEEFKNYEYDCKRCPNCKIWTQKNEGCNHMTCIECNFNWCWLCEKEYNSRHYTNGKCKGKQHYKPLKLFFHISESSNNEEKILFTFLNILFYFLYTISFCLFNTYLFIYNELYDILMKYDIFIIYKTAKRFYNFFVLFYMIYTLIWNFCINVIVIIFASFFKYNDIIYFYNKNKKIFYKNFKNDVYVG